MTTDEPMDRLRKSVPDDHQMDAGAADRVEAALRVSHAQRHAPAVPAWRRPLALGAVAAVVLVVAVASLVVRDTAPLAALVMTDAEGVTVVLPDGSEIVDPADGFELPDGAVVTITDGGMATIDDTTIDEASVLEVRDGALVARVDVTTTDAARRDEATTTTTTVPERTTTTTEPARAEDRPATTTTTEAPVDDRPDDRTTTTTRAVERGEDEPAIVDPDPPIAVDIGLQVDVVDGGLRVRWLVVPLEFGWQVVLHRQIGDGARTVVVGPTQEAEGEILDNPDVPLGGDGPRVRYKVSVLDEAGELIGAGPFQSVHR